MSQLCQDVKIIFIGTPEFGAIVLEKLIQGGYPPVLVITAPDKPVGRRQLLTPPPVKLLASKYGITISQPKEIRSTKSEIRNLKPDLGIVAAYGQIIPKEILEIPKYGCLNVHPSLLPRWRGPSPIQSTILNGDKETGVTIMLMNEKVDAGPIISYTKYKIQNTKYTYENLHDKLAGIGGNLLVKTIPKWINGEIKAAPQDESKATFSKILKKEDGRIDWNKPAEYIERQVRALNPEPGTYDMYNGKILKILEVEISNGKMEQVLSVKPKIIIKKVQLEGKKPMAFEDFLLGHKDYLISLKTHCLA